MKRALTWLFAACLLAVPALAEPGLSPLPDQSAERVPVIKQVKKVRMVTTLGTLIIEVYPDAAPNASERFLQLVNDGFYDFTPIFRVIPDFVCQFGLNWRAPYPEWHEKKFADDPSYFRLDRGTLAFAKAGPDTNSTQVFINYGDNSRLSSQGGFTAFAKVVQGLEVAERFPSVGDPSMGLDQDQIAKAGPKFLRALPEQPAYILYAEVL